MEQFTTFISSRGILKSCGAHNARPVSSESLIDTGLLQQHHPGGSVYVCTDALSAFAREFLPLIEQPFTLVSGDSDVPVSGEGVGGQTLERILSHPHCQAWYAQNLAFRHAKLFALPIGLDYHTAWERPGTWAVSPVSPLAQERQLLDILARSPPFHERYLAVYCNFQHVLERGDRRECLESMDRSVCFLEPGHVPRASSWARQAEFLFVASPSGAGMDCHRTWEALLLGCIPIVRRSPLSELLQGLPALIVDDWSEVRRGRLESCFRELANRRFDFSPLFRDTWMRRVHGLAAHPSVDGTLAEFRRLLTRSPA